MRIPVKFNFHWQIIPNSTKNLIVLISIFDLFVPIFQTIMPFLESDDDMLKILATLTLANIVDEEENKSLIAETGMF